MLSPHRLRTRTTRSANQHRFCRGIHSAASFAPLTPRFKDGLASVRFIKSRANARRVSRLAPQRPESWASLRATMCSMSVSRVEPNRSPV